MRDFLPQRHREYRGTQRKKRRRFLTAKAAKNREKEMREERTVGRPLLLESFKAWNVLSWERLFPHWQNNAQASEYHNSLDTTTAF